jgi:hypothetical protein
MKLFGIPLAKAGNAQVTSVGLPDPLNGPRNPRSLRRDMAFKDHCRANRSVFGSCAAEDSHRGLVQGYLHSGSCNRDLRRHFGPKQTCFGENLLHLG